jgi:hypothetical protein
MAKIKGKTKPHKRRRSTACNTQQNTINKIQCVARNTIK